MKIVRFFSIFCIVSGSLLAMDNFLPEDDMADFDSFMNEGLPDFPQLSSTGDNEKPGFLGDNVASQPRNMYQNPERVQQGMQQEKKRKAEGCNFEGPVKKPRHDIPNIQTASVVDTESSRRALHVTLNTELEQKGVPVQLRQAILRMLRDAKAPVENVMRIITNVKPMSPAELSGYINQLKPFAQAVEEAFLASMSSVFVNPENKKPRKKKRVQPKLTPLQQALHRFSDSLDLGVIPTEDFAYPTKALARLGGKINHAIFSSDTLNAGLHNSNGSDCFLSSTFQVMSQMGPLMAVLEYIYNDSGISNDNKMFINEVLAFMSSLRGNPIVVYDPKHNATAVMRNFLTQERDGGPFVEQRMRRGHQDAREFFTMFISRLIDQHPALAPLFQMGIKSTLSLSTEIYEQIKLFDESTPQRRHKKDLECLLSLELTGEGLGDCLQKFSEEEDGVEIIEWEIAGEPFNLQEQLGLEQKSLGTKKLILCSPFPPILTIHLKRFAYDQARGRIKLQDAIAFPMSFGCGDADTHERCLYNLMGIIVHSGSLDAGHYWAYTKDRFSGQWCQFNDGGVLQFDIGIIEHITGCGDDSVVMTEGCKGTPYMLFYEKVQ